MGAAAQQVRRSVPFAIRRTEGQRALVEGIAYLSLDLPADGTPIPKAEADLRIDSWGTFMSLATLEVLAHRFMEYSRAADSNHDHGVIGTIVESYLTREGDPVYPPNVWVAKVKVHDQAVIDAIEAEELRGFSIEVLCTEEKREVRIEGIKRTVAIGELIDPYPLFLSLVKNPAIDQPFTSFERRSAVRARATARPAPPAELTHLVRCAPPTTPDEETMPAAKTRTTAKPTTPAPAAEAPAAKPETEATTGATETATRETALADKAKGGTGPARDVFARSKGEFTAARAEQLDAALAKRASNNLDFAATWAEVSVRLKTRGAIWDATYLLEGVLCEILYYSNADEAEQYALCAKAAADYATVMAEIVREAGEGMAAEEDADVAAKSAPAPTDRSAAVQTRAGKKISAARMEKLKAARAHLDEVITEAEGESDDSTEATTEQKSAPPAPVDTAREQRMTTATNTGAPTGNTTNPSPAPAETATRAETPAPAAPAAPDPMAAFEARMAGLEKRFEETSARAKTAETDLAKAREDLAAAQKRVAELEESRPPSHVREDDGAPAPKTPSEPAATKRNWGKGMLSGWSARPTDGDDSE